MKKKNQKSNDAVEVMNENAVVFAIDWIEKVGGFGLDDADFDLDDFKWKMEGNDTLGETRC